MKKRKASDIKKESFAYSQYFKDAVTAGASPEEFWAMSPLELSWYLEGRSEAFMIHKKMAAWIIASVNNLWSKKRVTVEDVLDIKTDISELEPGMNPFMPSERKFNSSQEFAKYMQDLQDKKDQAGFFGDES